MANKTPLFFGTDGIATEFDSADTADLGSATVSTAVALGTSAFIQQELTANSSGVTANKAVYLTTGGIQTGSNTNDDSANIIGISLDTATSAAASVITHGLAAGVVSSLTAGDRVYVQPDGTVAGTQPGAGKRVVQIGYVMANGDDVWVEIQQLGIKAS